MNAAHDELQAALYAAYVDQAELYTQALRAALELPATYGRGESVEDHLSQVLTLLDEVAKTDALLAPAKQTWELAGKPTNDALRILMNRIAELIQQLQRELQNVERAVQARRDQLAVELDDCNRRYRMQRAYQRES